MNCKKLWEVLGDIIFIPKMSLDFPSQKILIARILRKENELFSSGTMEQSYFGVIKSIAGTINELKGSGCYPKDLKKYSFAGNGKVFYSVFEKYQEWLKKNNFIDEIDKCWAIVEKINDLSDRELAEFKEKLRHKLWPFEPQEDAFILMIKGLRLRKVDETLMEALGLKGVVNVSHSDPFVINSDNNFLKNIQEVQGTNNINTELKLVWQKINKLIEQKVVEPEKILLIVPDLRLYSSFLTSGSFDSYFCSFEAKYDKFLTLAEIPIIKDLLVLLKVVVQGWQGDKIIQILTSPFLTFKRGMSRQWISGNLANLPPDFEIWSTFIDLSKQASYKQ